jgi:hypothetical protein
VKEKSIKDAIFGVNDFYPFDKNHVYQQRYRGPTRSPRQHTQNVLC